MPKVCVYDVDGKTAKIIAEMSFWQKNKNFRLVKNGVSLEQLNTVMERQLPDLLIIVADRMQQWEVRVEQLRREYTGIQIIVIGKQREYAVTRKFFLAGAMDYLVQPLNEKELEKSMLRMYENKGYQYVMNELHDKLQAFAGQILSGGVVLPWIADILGQITQDFPDSLHFQYVADTAKKRIYHLLLMQKPWLVKFLYKKDYDYQPDGCVCTKKEMEQEWNRCFQKVSDFVKKYQMINNKLVYRIGEYVVEHVDEKLSLERVAEGVYLNASYVSSVFKRITGINFTDYVAEAKVDRARVLLREPNRKIYDIAAAVGYHNAEYFTKIFKKKTGMAPIEYQKMLQKQ